MELPTKPRKPKRVNPGVMLLYSTPKLGKSTILAGLTTQFAPEKSIVVSTEEGGYDYLEATVVEAFSPPEFEKVLTAIEANDKIEYVIIDTITRMDEWSEIEGTYRYMRRPQGKKFNREGASVLSHKDDGFQTVHEIPQGFGYRYSREVMVEKFDRLRATGKTIILVAHVKDKFITNTAGDTVQSIDINLTGKVKDIYCTKSDAIAVLVAEGDKRYLNFRAKDDSKYMGSRASHLHDKVFISEKTDNEINTYWENVFK